MPKTDTTILTTDPVAHIPAPAPAPATPTEGGSYRVDDATGEHTLIERTQPKEQA